MPTTSHPPYPWRCQGCGATQRPGTERWKWYAGDVARVYCRGCSDREAQRRWDNGTTARVTDLVEPEVRR